MLCTFIASLIIEYVFFYFNDINLFSKIYIIPYKENVNGPNFSTVVFFPLKVFVQIRNNFVGVKKFTS